MIISVTWLVHMWGHDNMCDMTRSRMGRDSPIRCLFFSITSLSPIHDSPICVDMILCVLWLTYLLDTTFSNMLLIFLYYNTLPNSRLTHICRHNLMCAMTHVSWMRHVTHIIIFSSITSLSPIHDSLIFVETWPCVWHDSRDSLMCCSFTSITSLSPIHSPQYNSRLTHIL